VEIAGPGIAILIHDLESVNWFDWRTPPAPSRTLPPRPHLARGRRWLEPTATSPRCTPSRRPQPPDGACRGEACFAPTQNAVQVRLVTASIGRCRCPRPHLARGARRLKPAATSPRSVASYSARPADNALARCPVHAPLVLVAFRSASCTCRVHARQVARSKGGAVAAVSESTDGLLTASSNASVDRRPH
jgi:hypothetical protein